MGLGLEAWWCFAPGLYPSSGSSLVAAGLRVELGFGLKPKVNLLLQTKVASMIFPVSIAEYLIQSQYSEEAASCSKQAKDLLRRVAEISNL